MYLTPQGLRRLTTGPISPQEADNLQGRGTRLANRRHKAQFCSVIGFSGDAPSRMACLDWSISWFRPGRWPEEDKRLPERMEG